MINKLTKPVLAAMKNIAKEEYPKEACGFILRIQGSQSLWKCENIAEDPENRFVISPIDYANAEDVGEIIGIWHTHVEEPATPSEFDIYSCNESELPWFILDIYKEEKFRFGDIVALFPSMEELQYTGRPYVYGVYDCFSLVKEYLKKEMKLDVQFTPKGYPEVKDLGNSGGNLLLDGCIEAGFEQVTAQRPKKGDVILINLGADFANHVAVCVDPSDFGDSRILHHCKNRLSEISVYPQSYWQKHCVAHLRHKELQNAD